MLKTKPILIFARPYLFAFFVLLGLLFFGFTSSKSFAAAGTNEQLNYQGRLLTNTGAVVPDGTYNMEFKITQDGDGCPVPVSDIPPCGGSVEWTETRTGGNKVLVKNGYFSVYLGSVTAFGTSVDWNQDTLWLSVNIGGTGSPSWDGELEPFSRLSSTPYALNSKSLGGLLSSDYLKLAQGVQADTSLLSSLYINKTGASGNILELEKNGTDVLLVSNTGALTFQNSTDSTSGLSVLDADGGTPVFSVDTTNERVGIGDATPSNTLTVGGTTDIQGHTSIGSGSTVNGFSVPVDGLSGTTVHNTILVLDETITSLSSATTAYEGLGSILRLNPSGAPTYSSISGFNGGVEVSSGNAENFSGALIGSNGIVFHNGTGTVSSTIGMQGVNGNIGGGTITDNANLKALTLNISGTITNNYGLDINTPVNAGTVTNNYGIRVQDQSSVGSTNSYNILSLGATAKNYFEGLVGIGDNTPDAKLEVLSTTEQLRLTHTDGSADSRFTVDSSGDLTINNTGTKTVIADGLEVDGTITAGSGNEILTLSTGKIDADALTLTVAADGGTGTSSGSGLIVRSDGIGLLQGCSDNQVLKWVESTDTWDCATVSGGSGNSFETVNAPSGTDPVADNSTDTLNLSVTGTNLTITGDSSTDTLTFDIDESVLAGAGLAVNSSALDVGAGTGITVNANDVAVNQDHSFAWTNSQSWTLAGAEALSLSYSSAPTTDLLSISNSGFGTTTDGVDGLNINFAQGAGAGNETNFGLRIDASTSANSASDVFAGSAIYFTNTSSTGIQLGMAISNLNDAANATTEALLYLSNTEGTADTVTDYLQILATTADTTADAIDVSDAELFNALNVGANNIVGTTAVINFSNFDVSSTGAITGVGVDSGTGLIQGTGGATISGGPTEAISLVNTTGAAGAKGLIVDSAATSTSAVIALEVAGTQRATLRASSLGNVILSGSSTGALYLNFDGGTGGVVFSNGASGSVGTVSSAGNADFDGTITAGSGNEVLTLSGGKIDADALTLTVAADGGTGTSSGSGLIVRSDGIGLLQGCSDTQILKWVESTDTWDCAADATGGGGSDLQATYGSDVDGSNATISLTSADDSLIFTNPSSSGTDSAFLLQLDQANTTAVVSVLDLIQASNASNALNITANAIDGEVALAITANGLTSGEGLTVSSSSTGLTSGGSIAEFTLSGSDAANLGSVIKISNTGVSSGSVGLYIDHRATGTGNLALRVDDVASDTSPFVIDGEGRVGIGTTSPGSGLQVGSETNHLDAKFYGDVTKAALVNKVGLTNITDIFIYDTTRDNDMGKWADSYNARNMSWYGETKDHTGSTCVIASDDRCGGSRFPAKAILVTTPDALYIFDADDNTMWAKFTQGGTYALGGDSNNNPSSVFAVNGVIHVGTNGTSSTGLYSIDFTQDRMYRYNATDRNEGDKTIVNRNTTVGYTSNSNTGMKFIGAASIQVNDVHGSVISGSSSLLTNGGPANGATIICAATDDGVQVINLTTGVTIPFGSAIADQFSACFVTKRARMYVLDVTKQQLERYGNPATSNNNIDTAIIAPATGITTPYKAWDESATAANAPNLFKTAQTFNVKPDTLEVVERGSLADEKADLIYVGHGGGLTEIHDLDTNASPALGWSKFYSKDGETGLMTGTPRGQFGFGDAVGASQATDTTVRNNVLAIKTGVTMGVNGVRGMGARFDGTAGYMCSDTTGDGACDQDTDFDPTATTVSYGVEMWFRHNGAVSGTDTLIDRSGNATVAGYNITMNSSGQVVAVQRDGTITDTLTSTMNYADSQWHHLSVVRASASALYCMYVDGKLAVACDTATTTATLNGATATAIGAKCTGTVATCSTQQDFWDGDIDDVYVHGGGATTADNLTQAQVRKTYLDGRSALSRPSTRFADATTATTTTIGDSTATWVPNSFVGSLVEITADTGVGQTRRVVSNTATVLTVSPAFTSSPDTSSDFEVMPEQLYGSTNTVYGIGLTDNSMLSDNRKLYVGTNDGSDGGGVTVLEGQGTAVATDVYHADAGKTDDTTAAWTGGDYDDIQSIGTNGTSMAMGSLAHFWTETDEMDFQVSIDAIANRLNTIRGELLVDGIIGSSVEIGASGGADLAERYTSSDELSAGNLVSLDPDNAAGVKMSSVPYQKDLIGIVATEPGLILGPDNEQSHPIALAGRVPVRVTTENGQIKSGDRITSSSTPGYAMKATVAGRVVGTALNDFVEDDQANCPENLPEGIKCGTVTVFVNLSDYSGASVDLAVTEAEGAGLLWDGSFLDPIAGLVDLEAGLSDEVATANRAYLERSDKILRYLAGRQANGDADSEVLTDRVSAGEVNGAKVYAGNLYAATITVDKLKANQIEGLEIFTDKIASLEQKRADDKSQQQGITPIASDSGPVVDLSNFVAQRATIKLDLTVKGSLVANGGLTVDGDAQFRGNALFYKLVTFVEKTVFNNDVSFEGRTTFNNDTAGFAVIKANKQEIEVKFKKPYESVPVVTLNVKNGLFEQYAYKNLTKDGFTIVLKDPAIKDIEFAWTALSVNDARTVHYDAHGILKQQD